MEHTVSFTFIPNGPERKMMKMSEYPLSDIPKKAEEISVLIQKSINEAKRVLIESSKYTLKWTIDFNALRIIKTSFLGAENPLEQFLQNVHEELFRREKLLRRK